MLRRRLREGLWTGSGRSSVRAALRAGLCAAALVGVAAPALAQMEMDIADGIEDDLNPTELGLALVARDACNAGGNLEEFQAQCEALAGASDEDQELAIGQLSPEQLAAQGSTGTKLSGGQMRQISGGLVGRLSALRAGPVAALEIQWRGDKARYGLREALATGAAGEDGGPTFGVYLNGTYGTGDVNNTSKLLGFNYDAGGLTVGGDVTFEMFAVGAAFSWLRAEADYKSNAGDVESDSFNGSFYGTFFPIEGLYLDGIVTFGGTEYDTKRKIRYSVPGATVVTNAKGDPDGEQFAVSGGVGYDVALGGLTLTPYFRAAYARIEIDGYSENGGAGWALRYDSQNIDSVTTTLGSEVAYAFSLPFGVLVPQLRGEWIHEYEDDDRRIGSIFTGDTSTQGKFKIVTDSPDRDYFTLGAETAMTFARGVGAFAAYEVLLGYEDVESHRLTFGGRLEF
ncbi:MAG: autotransporter outer membrane beta-barrel domain-containing protein [Myxococcota bacterium]